MSALPNSHEALLKNLELVRGRVALLGVTDLALLARLPTPGLVVTEHVGVYRQLAAHHGWQGRLGYDDPALAAGAADTLVVFLPKARAELNMRLALTAFLAAEGGRIILVGEKREGIAGATKQLKTLAPEATKVDSARHCQVWLAELADASQPFDVHQWIRWHEVERQGIAFEVAGLPGIFSDGRLDEGTALLLDSLAESPVQRGPILDFACGAGVIGTWLQLWQRASSIEEVPVDAVDVQAQAVFCTRETYRRSGVAGKVAPSDGLDEVTGKYRAILTNPPFHTGIRTDTSMTERFLQQVAAHLMPGGELRLVANSFLPYGELIRRFVGPVEVLHRGPRFTVYSAKRH